MTAKMTAKMTAEMTAETTAEMTAEMKIDRPISRSRSAAGLLVAGSVLLVAHSALGGDYVNLGAGLTASGASFNGSVVVGTDPGQYWYWTAATGVVFIGGAGDAGGQAKVSADGGRIVGTVRNPKTNLDEMGIYSMATGTWTPLGGLGGSSGTSRSSGWGISSDGATAVGLGWISAGSANAMRWNEVDGVTSMGTTVPGRSTRANACNADGSVLVGWQDSSSGFRQGAVWVDGVQTLMTLNGAPLSEASDVSDDGVWVVGSGSSSNGFNAWRWSAKTGAANIGTPPVAGWRGASVAVSADGATVVGFYRPFPGPATFGNGFIWTAESGMLDLTAYALAQGVELPAGIVLALPLGISGDGRTIVGISRNPVAGFKVTIGGGVDCPADFTGDGVVDGADLAILLGAWGTNDPAADLSGNGVVDGADLSILLGAWGPCGS